MHTPRIAIAPPDGIPAPNWDGVTLTASSAVVTFLDRANAGWQIGAETATVFNVMPNQPIAGDTLLCVDDEGLIVGLMGEQ